MTRRLRIVVPALLLALVLGGGYLAASTLLPGGVPLPFLGSGGTEQALAQEHEAEPVPGVTLSTKERVVTLADTQALRYLKTEVVLEFAPDKNHKSVKGDEYKKLQEELAKELAPVLPAVEDIITTMLASRTAAQVTPPSGKDQLKTELMERLNRLPLGRPVRNVYFTQFIIQ